MWWKWWSRDNEDASDWPDLPAGALILYEHADPACPQRLLIYPFAGGYAITFVSKLFSQGEAPPLSAEQVKEIARKMTEFVS